MQSTLTMKDADPHDIFLIEPEIVRALRASKSSSDPAHDAKTAPSAPQAEVAPSVAPDIAPGMALPRVEPTFRAPAVDDIKVANERIELPGDRPAMSKFMKRVAMGLFALASAGAAAAWQHYGDTAKVAIADYVPPFVLAWSQPTEKPAAAEQPGAPAVEAAAADQGTAADQAVAQPLRAARASRRACGLRRCCRYNTVAANDVARSRQHGATDRAIEGQHRSAQGRPGPDVPRNGQNFGRQDCRGQNVWRDDVRAELATQTSGAPGARSRGAGAQAEAGLFRASAPCRCRLPAGRGSAAFTARHGSSRAAIASNGRGRWTIGAAADAAAVKRA